MADIRMNTFLGDLETLGGSVDAFKTALFNMEAGPLRGVVQGMTRWIDANQQIGLDKVAQGLTFVRSNMAEIEMWAKRIAVTIAVWYGFSTAVSAADVALRGVAIASKLAAAAETAAVVGTRGAVAAYGALSGAASLATARLWLWNAAVNIGTLGTKSFAAATVASTAASQAKAAAVWVKNTAVRAYTATTGIATAAIAAYRAGTLGALVAEHAQAAATAVKTVAMKASSFATAVAATAHGSYATSAFGAAAANGSLAASFAPFLVTIAAVTAAIGAMYAAWTQWKSLNAETEGLGITGLASEMWKQGTFDPAEALNNYQNEQARGRAQMVTPQDRTARTIEETKSTTTAEVTIRDTTGKAQVTKPPKGGGVGLRLAQSGAF
jgi:hypothetical protein